jgi:hypothetical protein
MDECKENAKSLPQACKRYTALWERMRTTEILVKNEIRMPHGPARRADGRPDKSPNYAACSDFHEVISAKIRKAT